MSGDIEPQISVSATAKRLARDEKLEAVLQSLITYRINPALLQFNAIQSGSSHAQGGYGDVFKAEMFSIPSQLPDGVQVTVETRSTATQTERLLVVRSENDSEVMARHQVLGSFFVAVKKLRLPSDVRPEIVKRRFVREMQVWSRLDHQNIVKFFGFYMNLEKGDAWLISRWYPNGSLDEMLKKSTLGKATRGMILEDTAHGLMYLHGLDPPIVHGDIKPSNVLMTPLGRAQLCDFGLSRIITSEGPSLDTTAHFKDSVRWCSPEVLNGEKRTPESDVWSWGVLAFQVATDVTPLYMEPDGKFIASVQKGYLPLTLGLLRVHQPMVAHIIQRCWYMKPSERRPIAETYHELQSQQSGQQSRKSKRLGIYLQIGLVAWFAFLGLVCWELGLIVLYIHQRPNVSPKSWIPTFTIVPLIPWALVIISGGFWARSPGMINEMNIAASAFVHGEWWPYRYIVEVMFLTSIPFDVFGFLLTFIVLRTDYIGPA